MPWAEDAPLTRPERQLRMVLLLHALLCLGFCVYYIAGGFHDADPSRLVINSTAKDAALLAMSLLAAAHVRRFGWLTLVIVATYLVLMLTQVVVLARGENPDFSTLGVAVDGTFFVLSWFVADLALVVLLTVLYSRALAGRYRLGYLLVPSYLTLAALAEVLVTGEDEPVPPDQIARNVDRYLSQIPGRGRRNIQLALVGLTALPLLYGRLPFPVMAPDQRLAFVKRRFVREVAERGGGPRRLLRRYVQPAIRVASQFTYLGYYGDARSHASVGYEPFSERPGAQEKIATVDRNRRGVECVDAGALRNGGGTGDAEVVVIGSGAAGAILAFRLAEAGRRVLVLERGPHVDPRDFVEDEVAMYLKLYNDGALQVARDFRFQVLQGMCVGGSTVVNNAVCFDPPEHVLEAWASTGVDRAGIERATEEVRDWLRIGPVDPRVANPAGELFARGAAGAGLGGKVTPLDVNIQDCFGCGYCNIGCAFGRKLSMLDTVLPEGQARFGDRLRVLADCRATGIEHDGSGRAVAVHADGGGGREPLRIKADTVVVAAGAVGSSWLLLRSGLGGPDVGRELYFNMTSPLTADFEAVMDAHHGLQMSHAYEPPGEARFVIETWFNPVATQALAMPGWFEDHYANMRRYRHMVCGGVLVGTTTPARVTATKAGPVVDFTPSAGDLRQVVDGLKLLGRVFLGAGALRVMPATYAWHEFSSPAALDALDDYVRDGSDLLLTSAHPQGGNALGTVVDERFAVRGSPNVHVCDASVFPSSVTVNPQLTVMALAQHGAQRILETTDQPAVPSST